MAKNFPNLKKETDIEIQEAEGPKQSEPKQTYTKTYYNKKWQKRKIKREF